jgi:holo-[acyl-carrier protein] synthase
MLVGLGVDVASLKRVERAVDRFGVRFTERILTELEIAQLARRADRGCFVAGRFAVKEAAFKALGGPRDVGWHDLEVDAGPEGAPILKLRGAARSHADRLGVSRVWVSISHDAGVAAAVVVLESS